MESYSNAPGKGLLKVTGIIMIIFGAIAAIVSILAIVAGGAAASLGGDVAVAAGGIAIVAGIVALISAAFEIVVGIIGVKNCDKPEKAQTCFILAIVAIVLQIIGLIMGGTVWTLIIGLILPVLYLVGALKNKQAAA